MNDNQIIQYDYNFIMSIQNNVSNRLPAHIHRKVCSYGTGKRNKSRRGFNKFLLRNANTLPLEKVQELVKKGMTQMLNKVTIKNLDIITKEANKIIELLNNITEENKLKVHQQIMSILLNKAIHEKCFSQLYATILQSMIEKIYIDYREYLDNLFMDIKKNNGKNISKDYDTFCRQLKNKIIL